MPLFAINRGKLNFIEEEPFRLEKDIQKISEENLTEVFSLKFVRSEFSIGKFRVDTLAFDEVGKSFLILEYKRDKNFSVIDQGYAYLSLMLNNKADFILEFNESCHENLKRNNVDWSQSRVVFVSPSFTDYQKEAINFRDLPIELWEIKRYQNNTLSFNSIQTAGSGESISSISRGSPTIKQVSREVKVYTEGEHLQTADDDIKELYAILRGAILNIGDNITVKPTKLYIGFVAKRNIIDIHIQKRSIKIWINVTKGQLDDPKSLMRNVSSVGHWGNGDYELLLHDDENIEYIISLTKQAYRLK